MPLYGGPTSPTNPPVRAQDTCLFEPGRPAGSSPHRPGLWLSGSSDEGCAEPGGVQVEETVTYRRYQQEAPMLTPDGDFGTAWFACLGFILHPLVSIPPPSSSGHNSPFERCDPLCEQGRGAVLGHGSFLNGVSLRDPVQKVTATCGGFARRLAHPLWPVQLERYRAQSSVPSRERGGAESV